MDTIGFALEEIVGLPSELNGELTKDEDPKWKRRIKICILIVIWLSFFLFVIYQVMATLSSYKNPTWTSYEDFRDEMQFPGVSLYICYF
jgi:hypothetical protein